MPLNEEQQLNYSLSVHTHPIPGRAASKDDRLLMRLYAVHKKPRQDIAGKEATDEGNKQIWRNA